MDQHHQEIHTVPRKPTYENSVHNVLAHSYSFYFVSFLVAVIFYTFFPIHIFNNGIFFGLGVFLLFASTMLIFWSQHTSRNLKEGTITYHNFLAGPYKYSRSPTHVGLFLLMFGFAFIVNSFFVALFSIISFIITKMVFIRKEEQLLAQKYGAPYKEYQQMVRM